MLTALRKLCQKGASHHYTVITAVLLTAVIFSLVPLPSQAFTVTPIRLELEGNPGQTIDGQFKIYNDKATTQTFYPSAQNFEAQDETGNPVFVNTKDGLVSWIHFSNSSYSVKPREEVAISFTIDIPRDAEPGGYFSGVFGSTVAPSTNNPGEVAIGSRIGTLLLVRINGNISEGISILEFGATDHARIYASLPISFYFRFQNSGADRIKPLGDVLIKNTIGRLTKILNANKVDGNVLPKSIRRFETQWLQTGGELKQDPQAAVTNLPSGFFAAAGYELTHFAFGLYTANLNLAYGNIIAKSATAKYTFFIIPWQLLIIVLGILLIAFIFLWVFMKRYNRMIIKRANRR